MQLKKPIASKNTKNKKNENPHIKIISRIDCSNSSWQGFNIIYYHKQNRYKEKKYSSCFKNTIIQQSLKGYDPVLNTIKKKKSKLHKREKKNQTTRNKPP